MSNPLNDPTPIPQPDRLSAPACGAVLRLVAPNAATVPIRRPRADAGAVAELPEPRRRLDSALGPLWLRSLRPPDVPAHEDFLSALGERGRRMRAFALPQAPSAGGGATLRLVLARVAQARGSSILLGELHICIDRKGVAAEFALAVRPELSGRGLGRLLIGCLLDACRMRRVTLVCASVPCSSGAMLVLAREGGFQVLRAADGSAQLALMLRPRGVR